MTETQWARITSDIEHLQAVVYSACASPLVWLPLAICIAAATVFAYRGFAERHSYTRVGRNASFGCMVAASVILAVGAWSHSSDQPGSPQPSATVTSSEVGATGRG